MYRLIRPLLFRLNPETAHALTLDVLRFTGAIPPLNWAIAKAFTAPPKPVTVFGLTFRNPVGLAAGYDKDAVVVRGLAALGFGHIEVGTVTPRPQEGNPRPRVFRLVEDRAVINRMGFPGKGAEYISDQLSVISHWRSDCIIGVNLGKNKDTPLENAAEDYLSLIRTFAPLADYLAINVSSPNTFGLRRLQGRDMLEKLLGQIAVERGACSVRRPILVKLAPDLSDEELDDAIDAILQTGMDGIIATNTTLEREGLRAKHREESGGLSGSPLRVRSEAVLREVVKRVAGRIPVVSVGGIMSSEDAKCRLDMGAALVQVYTGLVYAGPGLVQKIIRAV
jgi:dihydroorotate dehydrogenase